MNIFESVMWVAVGFTPTFVAMKVAWKMAILQQKKMPSIAEGSF
jgi:hypothetical protein